MRSAVFASVVLISSAAALSAQANDARPIFVNGQAQLVPAFQDTTTWIHQELWVETNFDTDKDGKKDRVHVDVTRPGQTDHGLKVPIVMGSSPYYAGTARPQVNWDVQVEVGAAPKARAHMNNPPFTSPRPRISTALVNQWVPRGFAVVHSEAPGTGLSSGCPTVGDYPEREAPAAVIDWLNGRARGYTTKTGNVEVRATSWSTGKVGMMGTSYEGTLPLAAATTGVKGLEVVIPVSPNTSYYHYYRSNGLVRSPGGYLGEDVDVLYDFIASGDTANRANCDRIWKNGVFARGQDRASGDMNQFWKDRDLLLHLDKVKAAVLLAHGTNDYNVVPEHSVRIYNAMKAHHQPVSIYLHTGGHGGNPPPEMVNRWFTHYLYGVDNGVEKDPPVWIVQDANMQAPLAMAAEKLREDSIAAHPPAQTPAVTNGRGGRGGGGGGRAGRGGPPMLPTPFASFPVPGTQNVVLHPIGQGTGVGRLAFAAANDGSNKLVDDVALSGSANAAAMESNHRLLYATVQLRDTVHISGTPRVTLRIASSKPAANLTVWLVMLPYDSANVGSSATRGLITRGWADIRDHKALTKGGNYESLVRDEALVPGKFYDLTFDLEPDDEFVPPGKRLAVMVMSSDREFTLWPQPGTELTVDLAHSSFTIPIVGGRDALVKAGGM